MGFSPFGRKLIAAQATLILIAIIVMAFSIKINLYTDFFYQADKFMFGISLVTFLVLGALLLVDLTTTNALTGRAQIHCIVLTFLSLFWLAFSSFATSRYTAVPYNCYSAIPAEMVEMRSWCVNINVVKAFMWIEWFSITALLVTIGQFTATEYSKGNLHVMKKPLSRYDRHRDIDTRAIGKPTYHFGAEAGISSNDTRHPSEFLQYEKTMEETNKSPYYKSQRYEAPSNLHTRNVSAQDPVTPTFYAEASGYGRSPPVAEDAGLAGVGRNAGQLEYPAQDSYSATPATTPYQHYI